MHGIGGACRYFIKVLKLCIFIVGLATTMSSGPFQHMTEHIAACIEAMCTSVPHTKPIGGASSLPPIKIGILDLTIS